MKSGDLKTFGIKISTPAKNWFWESMDMKHIILIKNKGEKKSLLIDNDRAATTETPDDWDRIALDLLKIQNELWVARDPHHNSARRTPIDEKNIKVCGA